MDKIIVCDGQCFALNIFQNVHNWYMLPFQQHYSIDINYAHNLADATNLFVVPGLSGNIRYESWHPSTSTPSDWLYIVRALHFEDVVDALDDQLQLPPMDEWSNETLVISYEYLSDPISQSHVGKHPQKRCNCCPVTKFYTTRMLNKRIHIQVLTSLALSCITSLLKHNVIIELPDNIRDNAVDNLRYLNLW